MVLWANKFHFIGLGGGYSGPVLYGGVANQEILMSKHFSFPIALPSYPLYVRFLVYYIYFIAFLLGIIFPKIPGDSMYETLYEFRLNYILCLKIS